MWAGDRRAEAFAAWRRLIEALADERPLVLVFEDLHWADDALLDFVDYLVEWSGGVPLLVLCTARPELLVRRPGWGGGKMNSSTLLLSPLSDEETAMLLHALLGRSAVDADLQARLLEHAGGNPLYAEEFTRMLTSRPDDVVLPETVQGIIAARLDTLPADEKELLQHAAVIGRVFWLGALGGERWTLEARLHSLGRKEFVTRNRRSSVAGEDEYAFRHALVRDVAYEQIPRGRRADKHLATAEWIESLGRPEDHAEMLAYHYAAALDYAGAAGQDSSSFAERARTALREAGDRAFALNAFPAAARYYTSAVELWPAEDSERLELLFRIARSLHVSGDSEREIVMEEAREALAAAGRVEPAAEIDAMLAEVRWYLGDREGCDRLLRRAAAQVEHLAPVSGQGTRARSGRALPDAGRRVRGCGSYRLRCPGDGRATRARRATFARAEHHRHREGESRRRGGDRRPRAEPRDRRRGEVPGGCACSQQPGCGLFDSRDFRRSAEYFAEAVRVGEERGALAIARFSRAQLAGNLLWCGRWDEGLRLAEVSIAESESNASLGVRRNRARVLLARGEIDAAIADASQVLERTGEMKDPQVILPALTMGARHRVELGRLEDARSLAAELMQVASPPWDWKILDFAFVAVELGHAEAMRLAIEQSPNTRWTRGPARPPRRPVRQGGGPASGHGRPLLRSRRTDARGGEARRRRSSCRRRRAAAAGARVLPLGRRRAVRPRGRGAARRCG